jgi:hypothetical protein
LQIFTKSRAITLKILFKTTRKYPGAQQHMLINIPVKFHDSRSNTFLVMCNTKETDRWTRVNLNAPLKWGHKKKMDVAIISDTIQYPLLK